MHTELKEISVKLNKLLSRQEMKDLFYTQTTAISKNIAYAHDMAWKAQSDYVEHIDTVKTLDNGIHALETALTLITELKARVMIEQHI